MIFADGHVFRYRRRRKHKYPEYAQSESYSNLVVPEPSTDYTSSNKIPDNQFYDRDSSYQAPSSGYNAPESSYSSYEEHEISLKPSIATTKLSKKIC